MLLQMLIDQSLYKFNIRLFNDEVVSEDYNFNQTLQDMINFVRKESGSKIFH